MRAKQSLFVPAMILLSWGVLRWQILEDSAHSHQETVENSDNDAVPLSESPIMPTLLSRDFRIQSTAAKPESYSRTDPAPMIAVRSIHSGATPTTAFAKLPAPLQEQSRPALVPVNPQLIPTPQTSISADSLSAQPSVQSGKLSVSYWMLWRNRTNRAEFVDGGQIGASQGGMRLRAPIASVQNALQLSLSARLSQSLQQGEAPEGSIGASLSIGKKIPVELIAERRLKLGHSGDSAWSFTAATGLSEFKLTRKTELDGYVQLGIVGARSRRPFIGGNAIVSSPLFDSNRNKVRIGAGIWGDAQRGASRLDIGPDLTLRSSMAGSAIRISGQWRIRVAGEARPSSGPALIVGGDF
jgi:hypothetical protein